jgi:hypothetical protein
MPGFKDNSKVCSPSPVKFYAARHNKYNGLIISELNYINLAYLCKHTGVSIKTHSNGKP